MKYPVGIESQGIWWYRARCGKSEEVHAVMKHDLAGGCLPSGRFGANAAWWAIMVLAHNLTAAMKRLVLGPAWAAKRLKALRFALITLPGHVIRHGRRLIIRLGDRAGLDLMLAAGERFWHWRAARPDRRDPPQRLAEIRRRRPATSPLGRPRVDGGLRDSHRASQPPDRLANRETGSIAPGEAAKNPRTTPTVAAIAALPGVWSGIVVARKACNFLNRPKGDSLSVRPETLRVG